MHSFSLVRYTLYKLCKLAIVTGTDPVQPFLAPGCIVGSENGYAADAVPLFTSTLVLISLTSEG